MDLKEKLSVLVAQEKPLTRIERVKSLWNKMTENVPPFLAPMLYSVIPFDIEELTEEKLEEILTIIKEVVDWIEQE